MMEACKETMPTVKANKKWIETLQLRVGKRFFVAKFKGKNLMPKRLYCIQQNAI